MKHRLLHKRLLGIMLALACCASMAFGLAGCQSEEDQPTSAEQAEYEGKTLYQYNLDRGALALNSYDYDNLTTYGNFKYYLSDNNVVSKVGIDVSDNQKSINWSEVKAGGVDFAMIRIGYRGYTEGKVSGDDSYATNIKEAKDAGLKVGVYFFSQATTEAEAKEEATYVVDTLGSTSLDYPVVYDLETDIDDNARTKDLSSDQITANTLAFCKAIKTAGYTPMIYLNKNAATHQFDLSQLQDYPFWYAEYADEPTLGFDFAIWQFTNEGSAFGVEGDVDLSILFDESKLQAKESSGDNQAS